jgi:hypothetical protein
MVAKSTRLVTEAGDVHFFDEIIIVVGAFSPGQILSFWSFAYIASYNGELHPLKETAYEDNKSLMLYPLLDHLVTDLEVLA